MSCGIAQSFPDISCGWRRTQLKRLPTRVRGARGRILLRESILWNRGRVLILNLQMSNLKFILNIWIWEMRSLFHQTPILFHKKVQRLHAIKDRYGWECFHWGLSSYEFPARSWNPPMANVVFFCCCLFSSGSILVGRVSIDRSVKGPVELLWRDMRVETHPKKHTLRSSQENLKDSQWWYLQKRCASRPCRNANEPVAEITDLSLQNMPKGKQVWVSGVWMSTGVSCVMPWY